VPASRSRPSIVNNLELGAGVMEARGSGATSRVAATALSGIAALGEGRLSWLLLGVGLVHPGTTGAGHRIGATGDLVRSGLPVPAASRILGDDRGRTAPARTTYSIGNGALGVHGSGGARARRDRRRNGRAHVEDVAGVVVERDPGQSSGARGAEAGLTLRLRNSPIWARLAYTVDHAGLTAGGTEQWMAVTLMLWLGRSLALWLVSIAHQSFHKLIRNPGTQHTRHIREV